MSGFHGLVGQIALVLAIVLAIVATALFALGQRPMAVRLGRLVDIVAIAAIGAVVIALVIGPLLLITGLRPADMLHVVYGLAALAAVPIAWFVGVWRERGPGYHPSRYGWVAIGGFVLVGLTLRLIQTG
jgi:hypothetical protein